MQVLSPKPARPASEINRPYLADRLPTLSGKRIVAMWNGRRPGPGREFLTSLLRELDNRHGLTSWEVFQKPFLGNPAPADLVDRVVQTNIDAVITGLGD